MRELEDEGGDPRARPGSNVIVNQGGDNGSPYAEEMGRMFEQAIETGERRTELLQQQLEEERERIRMEDGRRVEERVSLAERSTSTVQAMTERLMQSDRERANEQLQSERLRAEEIARSQVKDKPANIVDKIVEGKISKYYKDVCLLEQTFVKDQEKTVKQILPANITVSQFIRFSLV